MLYSVLRRIHAEPYQSKIISCISGKIFLVFVNLTSNSKNYFKYKSFIIDSKNQSTFFYVSKNSGIGHQVLSKEAVFHYKINGYYLNKYQKTILWNHKKLNMNG